MGEPRFRNFPEYRLRQPNPAWTRRWFPGLVVPPPRDAFGGRLRRLARLYVFPDELLKADAVWFSHFDEFEPEGIGIQPADLSHRDEER